MIQPFSLTILIQQWLNSCDTHAGSDSVSRLVPDPSSGLVHSAFAFDALKVYPLGKFTWHAECDGLYSFYGSDDDGTTKHRQSATYRD